MRMTYLTLCALLAATPASAQGLGDLLGQVQTNAKASAFDAAIGSQAPGLSGLTQNLTAAQKARLLDLGIENAGTLGQVAAGASALGLGAGALTRQPAAAPAYQQQPQVIAPAYGTVAPTYQPQVVAPAYGTVAPTYQQQPVAPAYGTVAPTYQQQPVAPAYGTVAPIYQQQPITPAYGTTTQTYAPQPVTPAYGTVQPAPQQPDLLGTAIQLGIGALSQ